MRWRNSFLALSLGLVSLAAPAAQGPVLPHMISVGKSMYWPSSIGAGAFGRAEAAYLTPYSGMGAVMEWGDGLVYAHSPTAMAFVHDFGIEPGGFGVLRGNIMIGVLDRLVVETSSGLSIIAFDTSDNGIAFTTTAIANTSGAADALSIACADFNADGLQDIAAVCSNKMTVAVYRGTEAGTFVLDSSFTQSTLIEEIQPIQWTQAAGYTGLEIAARSNLGVRVHARTGGVLFGQLTGTTLHDMAVVGPYVARIPPFTTVETLDKLALFAPASGGNEMFSLHSSSGSETAFGLGAIGVVGADAGDYDGDGDWDLAVSQRSSHRLWILNNRTYAPGHGEYDFPNATFAPESSERKEVRIGEIPINPMPNNTARPLLQDITGDGIVDVLMGVRDEGSLFAGDYLYRVAGENDADYEDGGECPGAFWSYDVYPNGLDEPYGTTTNPNLLAVGFDLANIWVDYTNVNPKPADVYIEVTVRKQDQCDDNTIAGSPMLHALYWIDPAAHIAFMQKTGVVQFGFSLAGVTAYSGIKEFNDKYYAEVRMVRYVSSTISSPFSPTIISFTGEVNEPDSTATCPPTAELANDPGAYLGCPELLAMDHLGGGGDIDYIAQAYTQASLPPFGGGPMVYPELWITVAEP